MCTAAQSKASVGQIKEGQKIQSYPGLQSYPNLWYAWYLDICAGGDISSRNPSKGSQASKDRIKNDVFC